MRIFITTKFEGIHAYKDAPEQVSFLRNQHRHMFGVRVEMDVYHDDRELEFIMVKRNIDRWIKAEGVELNNSSCEMIGKKLIKWLNETYDHRCYTVTVDEDGENGAIVESSDLNEFERTQ